MAKNHPGVDQSCACSECLRYPLSETAKLHASINHVLATLDEKHRRRFVGLLATQYGYGGVQYFARVTGLSRPTILRGQREISASESLSTTRIRALGGGAHSIEKKSREL